MNAVELKNVTKSYGSTKALNKLSFTIPQGSICALIGPNGAGKTTTMALIAGLLRINQGEVNILGKGPFSIAEHGGAIGLMPQDSTPSLSAPLLSLMTYFGRLQGLNSEEAEREGEYWLERVHLSDKKSARYGSLSHGMRRRFSVAQAMMGNPSLILLDEPTSGLDPELVVEVRELIAEQRKKCTLIVSSHILSELESMCDYAVILDHGSCVRQGPLHELTEKRSKLLYQVKGELDLAALKSVLPEAQFSRDGEFIKVIAAGDRPPEQLNALLLPVLLHHSVGILSIRLGGSLEEAYLEGRSLNRKKS